MKWFWIILSLGIVGGGLFFMVDRSRKAERAEAYRRAELARQKEEEQERVRQEERRREDERIRKERMEAVAKEDAILFLNRYVDREKQRLRDTIEECKINLQMIDVDQRSLSDEQMALEKEEEKKAADAKRRGIKRRDKSERVDALLSSPTLNRLAATYLGEDLMSMRAKFRSHVGNLTKMNDEKTRRYAENRKKYQQTIKDSDEKVNRLTREATRQLEDARARLGSNVASLRSKVADLRKRIEKLEAQEKRTTLNMNEKKNLDSWRVQLDIAEAQLASAEATEGLGGANKAHLDVTVAETAARRTADTALSVRQDDDNAVEAEANREIAIYNAASQYENNSLDRIRDAIQHRRNAIADKMETAKANLQYLDSAVANVDLLKAEEIDNLRKTVTKRLMGDFNAAVRE